MSDDTSRFVLPINRRNMLAQFRWLWIDGGDRTAGDATVRPSRAEPSQASHPSRMLPPRAKNVIFCFMSGGVSAVDSFDPKPRLKHDHGKPMPVPIKPTMFNANGNIMASPWEFKNYGECGLPVSDLFPHIAQCADDLAVVRSMTSIANEHAQGNYFIHTGFSLAGYPSRRSVGQLRAGERKRKPAGIRGPGQRRVATGRDRHLWQRFPAGGSSGVAH